MKRLSTTSAVFPLALALGGAFVGAVFGIVIAQQAADWFTPIVLFGALGSAVSTAL